MRLRRVYIGVFILVFCLACIIPGVSFAADETVSVAGSVTPTSLPGNGQAQVTASVTVSASRSSGITGAHIEGQGVEQGTAATADIQPGDTAPLTCTLDVTAGQLGSPIQLFVKWDGETDGNPFTVTVASENHVVFTRTISPDKPSAYKGDSITVTYTVQNAGTADITDVSVADDGVPGMPQSVDTVAAGQTREFQSTFQMSADFTSAPKLSYQVNGADQSADCPAKTVSLNVAQLSAVLTAMPASAAPGGSVLLVCDLTNGGNVDLNNLDISDGAGDKYCTLASLGKGETQSYSREIVLTQTTAFQFTINAKDDDGKAFTFKTNEADVQVSSAGGQYSASIAANPDALQIDGPGDVNFDVVITNNGADPILNAYVTDQSGNTIQSYPSLPPGNTEFAYKYTIGETTQFTFTLVAPGEHGDDFKTDTGPVQIAVAPAASPQASPQAQPSATGDTQNASAAGVAGGLDWLVDILLVIGALIVVTIAVMVVLNINEKRRKWQNR